MRVLPTSSNNEAFAFRSTIRARHRCTSSNRVCTNEIRLRSIRDWHLIAFDFYICTGINLGSSYMEASPISFGQSAARGTHRTAILGLCSLAIAIAVLALLGKLMDIDRLESVKAVAVTMKANTAIGLILCAAAIAIFASCQRAGKADRMVRNNTTRIGDTSRTPPAGMAFRSRHPAGGRACDWIRTLDGASCPEPHRCNHKGG